MIVRELFTKLGFTTDAAAVRRYDGQFNRLRGTIRGITGALATLGAAQQLRSFVEGAEELIRVKAFTGATVEELQRLKFIAEQSETSFEDLSVAMRMFTLKTGVKPTVALFTRLAAQLQKLPEEKRLQALAKLFGPRGAPAIVQLLKEGPEGLRRLTEQFNRFGTTMSQKNVEAIDKFGDRLAALGTQFRGIRNQLLLEVLPALERLFDFFEKDPKTTAAAGFGGLAVLMATLLRFKLGFLALVPLIFSDINAWQNGMDSVFGRMLGSWESFSRRMDPVFLALDRIFAKFTGKYDDVGGAGSLTPGQLAASQRINKPNAINSDNDVLAPYRRGAYGLQIRSPVLGAAARATPPLVLQSSVTVNVPQGTTGQQADFIGEVVRKAILGVADELDRNYVQVEQ